MYQFVCGNESPSLLLGYWSLTSRVLEAEGACSCSHQPYAAVGWVGTVPYAEQPGPLFLCPFVPVPK